MPSVTGKKNKKPKQNTKASRQRTSSSNANRGMMEGTGAFLDAFFVRAAQIAVTYSLVAVTALGLIGVLLLFAGGYFFNISGRLLTASETMARNAGFEITTVSVKGKHRTSDIAILNAIYSQKYGETLGRSLLHFDLHEAHKKIETLGWVRHAAVTRLLPGTVHISIQERTPSAVWQSDFDGTLFVVDTEGVRIEEVSGDAFAGLPMIVNSKEPATAAEALRAIELVTHQIQQEGSKGRPLRAQAMRKQLVALVSRGERRWDLKFREGFIVMLPEKDIEIAVKRLAEIYARNPFFGRGLKYLDMRDKAMLYYKPRDGERAQGIPPNS